MAYFRRQGLNINETDKRKSTPLHWAAFAGAELSLSYIVAWDAGINAADAKGLTALHLAVKSCEDIRSTKGIKLLLIKGADRSIRDSQGKRPIDLISSFSQTRDTMPLV